MVNFMRSFRIWWWRCLLSRPVWQPSCALCCRLLKIRIQAYQSGCNLWNPQSLLCLSTARHSTPPRCSALYCSHCIVRSQVGSRVAVCGDNKPTSVSPREAHLRDIYMRPSAITRCFYDNVVTWVRPREEYNEGPMWGVLRDDIDLEQNGAEGAPITPFRNPRGGLRVRRFENVGNYFMNLDLCRFDGETAVSLAPPTEDHGGMYLRSRSTTTSRRRSLRCFGRNAHWFLSFSWTLVGVAFRNRISDVGKKEWRVKEVFNGEFEGIGRTAFA